MFKYIKDLIETKKQVVACYRTLKSKNDNQCKDRALSSLECIELGIERGSYLSSVLASYKYYLTKE